MVRGDDGREEKGREEREGERVVKWEWYEEGRERIGQEAERSEGGEQEEEEEEDGVREGESMKDRGRDSEKNERRSEGKEG